MRRKLVEAINGLDNIYRDVFILYSLLELKHREIADRLQIPEGSSKRRLSMARSQLRARLEGGL